MGLGRQPFGGLDGVGGDPARVDVGEVVVSFRGLLVGDDERDVGAQGGAPSVGGDAEASLGSAVGESVGMVAGGGSAGREADREGAK